MQAKIARAGAGEQEERRAKKTEGRKGEEEARIKERLRRKAQGESEMDGRRGEGRVGQRHVNNDNITDAWQWGREWGRDAGEMDEGEEEWQSSGNGGHGE